MQVHTSVSGTARSQRGVTKANAARSRSLLHVTAAQAHRRERNPAEKREEATQVQRREATGAVLASVAGVAHVGPADAALGLGGKSKQQKYYDETYDIINQVEYTLSLDKDDPNKVRWRYGNTYLLELMLSATQSVKVFCFVAIGRMMRWAKRGR